VDRARGRCGAAKIALKAGAVVGKYKMAKHFTVTITDADFSFARKQDAIDAEARLDGIYVVRTNLKAPTLDDSATVRAYKSLAQVERAIRSIKTVICTFDRSSIRRRVASAPPARPDTLRRCREGDRRGPANQGLAKAQRSRSAIAKQTHCTTPDGLPVHSRQTLLADLATLARNTVTTALNPAHDFVVHTRPSKLQQKALDLLAVNPTTCTQ
jgi:hypothetical protein